MVMDKTSVEKKVDVSSTFIAKIFRSGWTLVSSNDIITSKIDKKIKRCKKSQEDKQTEKIIFKIKIRADKWT